MDYLQQNLDWLRDKLTEQESGEGPAASAVTAAAGSFHQLVNTCGSSGGCVLFQVPFLLHGLHSMGFGMSHNHC
jgi:hypothetical protein